MTVAEANADNPHGAGIGTLPLGALRCGDEAVIAVLGGPPALQMRLRSMGVREGEPILVVKCAPLADPIEYSVGGMHVSLRHEEADHIMVRDVHHPWGRGGGARRWGWRKGRGRMGGRGGGRGRGAGGGPGAGDGAGRRWMR